MPINEKHVQKLRKSIKLLGHIYPVLTTKSGALIDGRHRLKADPKWPKLALKTDDPLDGYAYHFKLHDLRREFGAEERRELVNKMAEELDKKGYKPGKIGPLISKMIEYPLPTVDAWLEERFKMAKGPRPEAPPIKRELTGEIPPTEEAEKGGEGIPPAPKRGRPRKPTIVPCPWCSKPLELFWPQKRLVKGEAAE